VYVLIVILRVGHKRNSGFILKARPSKKLYTKDREQLIEEVIKIKQAYECFRDENEQLKIIEAQMVREIEGKNIAIKTLLKETNTSGPIKLKTQKHLTIALKKQIKSLREDLKNRDEKIAVFNRNPKITRIGELEIEQQILIEEIERLKLAIQEIINQRMGGYKKEEILQMRDTIQQQAILIDDMNEDKIKLTVTMKEKEGQLRELKALISKLDKNMNKLKAKSEGSNKKKKEFKEIAKEIKKLKEQLLNIKVLARDRQQIESQQKIDQLLKKQEETNDIVNQKTKRLRELEDRMANENAKLEKHINEASELKDKISKYKNNISKNCTSQILPIVKLQDIYKTFWTVKLLLMDKHIPPKDIHKTFFELYKDEDVISIYELSRILGREFKGLDVIKMARFVIEDNKSSSIEYDQTLEVKFKIVMKQLLNLLGDYEIPNPENRELMRQGLDMKFNVNSLSLQEKFKSLEKGKMTLKVFEKVLDELKVNLEPREKSYCVYLMYEKTKDIDKLQYEPLIEIVKDKSESGYDDNFDKESKGTEYKEDFASDKEESNKQTEEYKDDFNPEEEKLQKEDSVEEVQKSELAEKELNDENPYADDYTADNECQEEPQDIGINEEQLVKIVDEGLRAIWQQIKVSGETVDSLFGKAAIQQKVEGQQITVIPAKVFLSGVQKLNIEGLTEIHQTFMVKALAIDEEERFINYSDLVQILNDYDMKEMNAEDLDFNSLDSVSLVILLLLTDHLIASDVPIYDLLENCIYTQAVSGPNGTQREIEAIDAEGFFEVLQKMGIELETDKHENLQRFLAIVPEDIEKLSLDKLAEAMRIFATDEKLREEANKHYAEVLNENRE